MFIFSCIIIYQLNFSGYIETRPYLAWSDSFNLYGYNRGWLELKTESRIYGTQIALDCLVPYDTLDFLHLYERISIPRLLLWLGSEKIRIIAGKQSLYWGVGRIFRPLDVFNPANYFEPNYERQGSNAILGYLSMGRFTSVRAVCLPAYNLKKSFAGLRIGTNLYKNDIGLNLMYKALPKKEILGFEIAGDNIIGYWCEAGYTIEDTTNYAKVSLGIDYTFPFMIYSMIEAFYDESGKDNPAEYEWDKIFSGERTTLGKKYVYVTVASAHNPYLRPGFNTIINLDDQSFILIPQVSYSLMENLELTSGLNLFFGSGQSEFRNLVPYNGQLYIWIKIFF